MTARRNRASGPGPGTRRPGRGTAAARGGSAAAPGAGADPGPGPPRRVVLGVTGSIAAYKAAEVVRLFVQAGVEVHCLLTRSGAEFITPLTLGTLSGHPVTTDIFAESTGGPYVDWSRSAGSGGADPASAASVGGIRHIQVSRESGLIVVAPATGNILAKAAHGLADDALSTALLASSVPVLFAPAMNTRMWESAANQANVARLRRRGFHFVWPGTGELACGEMGTGRMAEPDEVVGEALRLLGGPGAGRRVLVTAGRTEEDLDPVRFLSNRSSGRMGFALAAAARDRGYAVTLVAGPTSVEPPRGVELVRVRTAEEMGREVRRRHAEHEILVMAAAVADYRARRVAPRKIPHGQGTLSLELEPTEDILASLSGRRGGRATIGFALETEAGEEGARRKLASKGVDCIVRNNPLRPGSEFGGRTNQVTIFHRDGRKEDLPLLGKYEVAVEILKRAEAILQAPGSPPVAARGSRAPRARRAGGSARQGAGRGRGRP